jgi:hypothetical protein
MKKTFKITAPNPGTLGAQYIFETGGTLSSMRTDRQLSRNCMTIICSCLRNYTPYRTIVNNANNNIPLRCQYQPVPHFFSPLFFPSLFSFFLFPLLLLSCRSPSLHPLCGRRMMQPARQEVPQRSLPLRCSY